MMMKRLTEAPELHRALEDLGHACIYLSGPDVDGQPTKWIACSTCEDVVLVPQSAVSTICPACSAICENPGCGLPMHEHPLEGCEFEPWCRCERCNVGIEHGEQHYSDPRCNDHGIGVTLCEKCALIVEKLSDERFASGSWCHDDYWGGEASTNG
jgi:hypothetical protein